MAGVLFSLILLLQGIPIQQGGSIKGVLRDSAGAPIPGIRMAAVARPDSLENLTEGTAMASIAETDAAGRYTLENIPPGRYVIAAGRLDLQTYYPGTQSIADARTVLITPDTIASDINFVLNNASFGRSQGLDLGLRSTAAVLPLTVRVENGAKLPVSADGRFVKVRLQTSTADVESPIDASSITLPAAGTVDVRVAVENLPAGYTVKTITYGTADVTHSTFRLSQTNYYAVIPVSVTTGATVASPPSTLSITLAAKPLVGVGTRVTGSIGSTAKNLIYMSGRPGVIYSDGSFEFWDVPAGRHVIATVNSRSTPRAAVVVIGDQDVRDVELKETMILPVNILTPKDPLPAGSYLPGTTVPLPRVSGIVLEESTKEPIREGEVVVRSGADSRKIPIDENGHFETFSLLPGPYEIRFEIFAHSTLGPTIVIDDKDLDLQMTTRRLY